MTHPHARTIPAREAPDLPSGAMQSGAMPSPEAQLAALRAEIDTIDDALLDLIGKRAAVVERLREAGLKSPGTTLRPAREATILRRLLARHQGGFPRHAIIRIWRELFAGTTSMQGPFALAVWNPSPGHIALAQAQFGAQTPIRVTGSAAQALASLGAQESTAAILPWPFADSQAQGETIDPWWARLLRTEPERGRDHPPRIVARLPQWPARTDSLAAVEAAVVALAPLEASGHDLSAIACETVGETSRTRLAAAFTEAGLAPLAMALSRSSSGSPRALCLVETEGCIGPGEPRLDALRGILGAALVRLEPVGCYAAPLPA